MNLHFQVAFGFTWGITLLMASTLAKDIFLVKKKNNLKTP